LKTLNVASLQRGKPRGLCQPFADLADVVDEFDLAGVGDIVDISLPIYSF
jgi:hypothetical protein